MITLNDLYNNVKNAEKPINAVQQVEINDEFTSLFSEKEAGWTPLKVVELTRLLPSTASSIELSVEFYSEEHGVFGKLFCQFADGATIKEVKGDPSFKDGKRYPGIKLQDSTLKVLVNQLNPDPKVRYSIDLSTLEKWKIHLLQNEEGRKIFRASF